MMRRTLGLLIALLTLAPPLHAEPTPVKIHVISQDGKFIGDSMGGAEVILRDAESGRVIAKGITRGGTGDTARIMESAGRSPLRASSDAANFSATLDLARPTLIRLEARAPMGHPGSVQRVSAERWLIPGQQLADGNGWTVEMPGLVVELVSVPERPRAGDPIMIDARITLMCGCPITPGGIWNADDYEVEALVYRRGRLVQRARLPFTASPGRFSKAIRFGDKGAHTLVIAARNRKSGNSGLFQTRLRVAEAVFGPTAR